ncbi:MAG: nicotinate (nicotinamide) nucleotide adenylyltransferase [bacterium]|nr:nicotinate (nicotinamide) nucleotide adenylyltransferase [bacterium]
MNLGILGGTFNPIHQAHLRLGEEAREALGLDRLLFIPAGDPPLKHSNIAPGRHRLALLELAIGTNPAFETCDLELRRDGPSYTVDTLEVLRERHADSRLWFVMGADTLPDLDKWHRPERLFELASFAIASRPGFAQSPLEHMPTRFARAFRKIETGWMHESGNELRRIEFTPLQISASEIRRRIRAGLSVRYLTPDEVIDYLRKHSLYSSEEESLDPGGPTS